MCVLLKMWVLTVLLVDTVFIIIKIYKFVEGLTSYDSVFFHFICFCVKARNNFLRNLVQKIVQKKIF